MNVPKAEQPEDPPALGDPTPDELSVAPSGEPGGSRVRRWPFVVATALAAAIAGGGYVFMHRPDSTHFGSFGCIEIGAKGVRAVVIDLYRSADVYDYHVKFKEDSNTTLIDASGIGRFEGPQLDATVEAVRHFSSVMRDTHRLPPRRISVIVTSGTFAAFSNQSAESIEAAHRQLGDLFGSAAGEQCVFVNEHDEGELQAIACVPKKYLNDAVLIDVGSGNTTACFREGSGRFVGPQLTLGAKAFGQAIRSDLAAKAVAFPKAVSDLADKLIVKPLDQVMAREAELARRPYVYLLGGSSWAMATLVRPEQRGDMVPIKAADIEAYRQVLFSDVEAKRLRSPEQVRTLTLSKIDDPDVRTAVEKDIAKVQKTYTPDDLIAGATILRSLSKAFDFGGKQVFFYRDGQYLPALGYILKDQSGVER